jgi:hypothetical protein
VQHGGRASAVIFDLLFVPIAFLMVWLADRQYRVTFSYYSPTASDHRNALKIGGWTAFSLKHEHELKWASILALGAIIGSVRFLHAMTSDFGWAAFFLLFALGVVANTLSVWWHIKLKFGKRPK